MGVAERGVPLSRYKPRAGENLAKGYVRGRFGGVPSIGRSPSAPSGWRPLPTETAGAQTRPRSPRLT